MLGRYVKETNRVVPLRDLPDPWGISALNEQQRFALELLLDESISLVTLAVVIWRR